MKSFVGISLILLAIFAGGCSTFFSVIFIGEYGGLLDELLSFNNPLLWLLPLGFLVALICGWIAFWLAPK